MLDAFGLINMNGRVYDPVIARFLSPDNNVQALYSSQGFNRYSYCFNNPLIYTDPSGNDPSLDLETYNHWSNFSQHQRNHDTDGGLGGGGYGGGSGGGSGGSYGLPGAVYNDNGGTNGTGLFGVYYDWKSETYRSTSSGNREVGWEYTFYHSYIPALRQQVQADQLANLQLHPQSNDNGLLAWVGNTPLTKANIATPLTWGIVLQQAFNVLGITAAQLLGVTTLALTVSGDTRQSSDVEYFFHYTNAAGLAGILATGCILPNAKGKVYLTDQRLSSQEVFNNLFLAQPTHAERGDFLIIFGLSAWQRASLQYDQTQPFEYIYPGTLRISPGMLRFTGPNPF